MRQVSALKRVVWSREKRNLPYLLAHQEQIHVARWGKFSTAGRARSGCAGKTLLAYGPAILPLVADALAGKSNYPISDMKRLIRACGQIGGADTIALLRQHLLHPHREIQEQILFALSCCGFRADTTTRPTIQQILERQAIHLAKLFAVQRDIGIEESTLTLREALQDEIEQGQRQLFAALSMRQAPTALPMCHTVITKSSSKRQTATLPVSPSNLP